MNCFATALTPASKVSFLDALLLSRSLFRALVLVSLVSLSVSISSASAFADEDFPAVEPSGNMASRLTKAELARLIEEGRKYLRAEDAQKAEVIFEKAVSSAPHSYRAHYGLGLTMLQQGRFQKAEENFLACTLLGPKENGARFGIASVYECTGRFADAVLVYKQIRRKSTSPLEQAMVENCLDRLDYYHSLGNPREKDYLDRSDLRRWRNGQFPLRVAIWTDPELKKWKEPFRTAVIKTFDTWAKASGGAVRYRLVDNQKDADMVCKLLQLVRGEKHSGLGTKAGETLWSFDDTRQDTTHFSRVEIFYDPHKMSQSVMESITLHELGHALGLGHSSNPRDIMFPVAVPPYAPYLSERDRNSIYALYGESQKAVTSPRK